MIVANENYEMPPIRRIQVGVGKQEKVSLH